MFYSTEILSFKNQTELSLVYYCSTNRKKNILKEKEIHLFNISKSILLIMNPPVPFALRLSIDLIKGIVVMWNLKKDCCKKMIIRFESKIKKICGNGGKQEKCYNVKKRSINNIKVDQFIKTLDDNINTVSLLDDVSEEENLYRINDPAHFVKRYKDQLEEPRSYLDLNNADMNDPLDSSITRSIDVVEKKVKIKVDKIISINKKDNREWIMLKKVDKYEFPILLKGQIIELFNEKINSMVIKAITEKRVSFTESNSSNPVVEYGRNETSLIEDSGNFSNLLIEESMDGNNEVKSNAIWFYELLVKANKGLIKPVQEFSFGEIKY